VLLIPQHPCVQGRHRDCRIRDCDMENEHVYQGGTSVAIVSSAIVLTVLSAMCVEAFRALPDRSPLAASGWVLFFLAGGIAPLVMAIRVGRALRYLPKQHRKVLIDALVGFVTFGWMTLSAALTLIASH
jgi:hypothetical protein